jgi:hypothetical protein
MANMVKLDLPTLYEILADGQQFVGVTLLSSLPEGGSRQT